MSAARYRNSRSSTRLPSIEFYLTIRSPIKRSCAYKSPVLPYASLAGPMPLLHVTYFQQFSRCAFTLEYTLRHISASTQCLSHAEKLYSASQKCFLYFQGISHGMPNTLTSGDAALYITTPLPRHLMGISHIFQGCYGYISSRIQHLSLSRVNLLYRASPIYLAYDAVAAVVAAYAHYSRS